jgi:hypothetical protein
MNRVDQTRVAEETFGITTEYKEKRKIGKTQTEIAE